MISKRSLMMNVLMIGCVVTLLSACNRDPTREWDEEVRLLNGQVVKVHRKQHWKSTHPLGEGRSYLDRENSLTVSILSEKPSAIWQGDAESPILLDKDPQSGQFFLVAIASQCWKYMQLGNPNPPYQEYRFDGVQWARVNWSGVAVGRTPNILVMPQPSENAAFIKAEEISHRNSLKPFRYKQIIESGMMPNC